jgi:hypothetical protein
VTSARYRRTLAREKAGSHWVGSSPVSRCQGHARSTRYAHDARSVVRHRAFPEETRCVAGERSVAPAPHAPGIGENTRHNVACVGWSTSRAAAPKDGHHDGCSSPGAVREVTSAGGRCPSHAVIDPSKSGLFSHSCLPAARWSTGTRPNAAI